MDQLRIHIDDGLAATDGPEIRWTWRQLLTAIGLAWREVGAGEPCDVLYTPEPGAGGDARLVIRADPRRWRERSALRLSAVQRSRDWALPVYAHAPSPNGFYRRDEARLIVDHDVIFDCFWLATGQEERHWKRDQHGFLEVSEPFRGNGALRQALGSEIANRLADAFAGLGFASQVPRWPEGKRAAACMTHDVDYPEVFRWLEPMRLVRRLGRRGIRPALEILAGRRSYWHFESWARLEQQHGCHSAFFFAARRGSLWKYATGTPDPFYDVRTPRFRRLFGFLADEGFEIGLHASYRAYESAEAFKAQKAALEQACGREVVGNRHHYWHLDPEDPETTLYFHEQAGFRYDMSVIHERFVGWRHGLSWPYHPFSAARRREIRTLQIPTAWMDDQLFNHKPDNPGDRIEILRALADRTVQTGGVLGVDIHDYTFDDATFPGWSESYRILVEDLAARTDVWFATPTQVTDHWLARAEGIVAASHGLDAG